MEIKTSYCNQLAPFIKKKKKKKKNVTRIKLKKKVTIEHAFSRVFLFSYFKVHEITDSRIELSNVENLCSKKVNRKQSKY